MIFFGHLIWPLSFDQEAFQRLRQQVSHIIPIPLNKDILISHRNCFISESNLVAIWQNAQISIENAEEFLPFIHTLNPRLYKHCKGMFNSG
jgi:hypothetical protein